MKDDRIKLYEWDTLEQLKEHFSEHLNEEEFDSILQEVRKDFKVRENVSVKESNKQFLMKLHNRITQIIDKND